jgi:hypothetical protein
MSPSQDAISVNLSLACIDIAEIERVRAEIPRLPSMRIVESDALATAEFFRRPRSKKRRIIKKWQRDPRNIRYAPKQEVFVVKGLGIVCHPIMASRLRAAIEQHGFRAI